MATNKVNPLSYQVPIVNKDGTPTQEFQRKWLQQGSTNSSIPNLGTAAAVSAVVDLLGNAPGSLLYRGATIWTTLAPGTDGQVLTTHGAAAPSWEDSSGGGVAIGAGAPTALEPAGTLYSQSDAPAVWSSQPISGGTVAHWEEIGGGGTPTTFYPGLDQIMDRWPLDLNGITLSAGGGGGSAGFVYAWTGPTSSSPSSSAFATKGTIFTALSDFEIDELFAIIKPGSTSETYSMGLYEVSTATGPVITSVVYQQTPASPTNTNNQTWRSGAVALSLTAGKRYALVISRQDATDTTAAPIVPTASTAQNSFLGAPIDYSKAEGPTCFVSLAKKTPTLGDAFSTPATPSYSIGMKAKVTT